jgi:hypothetical protein
LKLLREGFPIILDDKDHLPNKTDAIVHSTPPPDNEISHFALGAPARLANLAPSVRYRTELVGGT